MRVKFGSQIYATYHLQHLSKTKLILLKLLIPLNLQFEEIFHQEKWIHVYPKLAYKLFKLDILFINKLKLKKVIQTYKKYF